MTDDKPRQPNRRKARVRPGPKTGPREKGREQAGKHPWYAEFVSRVKLRLNEGREIHGDGSCRRHTLDLLNEIEQEFLDVPGWSAITSRRYDLIEAHPDSGGPPPSRSHESFLRRLRRALRDEVEPACSVDAALATCPRDTILRELTSIAVDSAALWHRMHRLQQYADKAANEGADL